MYRGLNFETIVSKSILLATFLSFHFEQFRYIFSVIVQENLLSCHILMKMVCYNEREHDIPAQNQCFNNPIYSDFDFNDLY